MTRYERRILSPDSGVYTVEGRIVQVLESPRGGRNTITVLVEVPDEETPTASPGKSTSGSRSKSTFFCQGTTADDEPCSREVDEPGERCFQHPVDDE